MASDLEALQRLVGSQITAKFTSTSSLLLGTADNDTIVLKGHHLLTVEADCNIIGTTVTAVAYSFAEDNTAETVTIHTDKGCLSCTWLRFIGITVAK